MRVSTPGARVPDAALDPALGVPEPIRRVAKVAALLGVASSAFVWVSSFLPSVSPAARWSNAAIPGFALGFGAFAVFVIDVSRRQARSPARDEGRWYWLQPRRSNREQWKQLMPGWRARAAPVLGAVAALSFVLTIFVGGLSGNPEHRGDRYFSNDHGRLEEITRDQYLHDRAAESRLFAGHATLFAGIATLYFTQPRPRHR